MIDGLNRVEMTRSDIDYGGIPESALKISVQGTEEVIDRLEEQIQSLIYGEETSNV